MIQIKTLKKNYNIAIHSKWWDRGIDITTLVWMLLFAGSMTGIFGLWAETLIWVTFPIFVLDLLVAYLRIRDFKLFLKKHWFTILITIPWLRVFRAARALRVFRAARAARGVKGARAAKALKITNRIGMVKSVKTIKLAKSTKSLKVAKSMKQATKLSKVTKSASKTTKFKKLIDISTYITYAQSSGEFYANSTRFLRPLIRSRAYTFIAGRVINLFRG